LNPRVKKPAAGRFQQVVRVCQTSTRGCQVKKLIVAPASHCGVFSTSGARVSMRKLPNSKPEAVEDRHQVDILDPYPRNSVS
jgi:hypothetical protein